LFSFTVLHDLIKIRLIVPASFFKLLYVVSLILFVWKKISNQYSVSLHSFNAICKQKRSGYPTCFVVLGSDSKCISWCVQLNHQKSLYFKGFLELKLQFWICSLSCSLKFQEKNTQTLTLFECFKIIILYLKNLYLLPNIWHHY